MEQMGSLRRLFDRNERAQAQLSSWLRRTGLVKNGTSEQSVRQLLNACERVTLPRQTILCTIAQPHEQLDIILAGSVKLLVRSNSDDMQASSSLNAPIQQHMPAVSLCHSGSVIGEYTLLDGMMPDKHRIKSQYKAKADEPTEVLRLPRYKAATLPEDVRDDLAAYIAPRARRLTEAANRAAETPVVPSQRRRSKSNRDSESIHRISTGSSNPASIDIPANEAADICVDSPSSSSPESHSYTRMPRGGRRATLKL